MKVARVLVSFVVFVMVLTPTARVRADPPCSVTPTGGLVRVRMGEWPLPQLDGQPDRVERILVRSYELYVPDGLSPDERVPLVVSHHGNSGSGANHGARSGWMPFADAHRVIAAFPNGAGLGLPNVPGGASWSAREGSQDVAFVREVVEDVASRYCVDRSRVYASGHSNGANLAQRLACDAEDVFAAAAWFAGGLLRDGCTLDRPVGVASFHGTDDETIPISDAEASRDAWAARLACTQVVSDAFGDGTQDRYVGCDGGVEVRWRVYEGQGHSWPEGERRDDLIARMWDHFVRHTLPGAGG